MPDRRRSPGIFRETVACLFQKPWTAWVGLRYLKSKKNSRFLSFITLISMVGVALGVTALVVVLSVMDGFEVEMRKRLMNQELHLLVTPEANAKGGAEGRIPAASFDESPLGKRLHGSAEVQSVNPILETEAILRGGRKVSGVVVKGAESTRLEELRKTLTESANSPLGTPDFGAEVGGMAKIYLGQALADEMDLIPGEIVTLISPTETDGPMSAIPRLKRFMVAGVYKSGVPEQELHTVYAEMSAVRSFLRRAGVVSQWEIVLKDFNAAERFKAELAPLDRTFSVQDWMDLNAHLFASLRLERLAMFISLVFIVIVASFNIVTTLTLMVLEKKREISILKAMGARDPEIGAVFLAEGVLIGGVGTALGMSLGFAICFALRRWQFIQLPDVYFDRTLPVSFLPQYYALIAFSALVIVLCASVYPSLRAARTDPLNGIRFGA
ncbi:MAG: FtsX-like permease family protein [Bdellovibrionales bacterium]|nr:FtsX-like permease family protein [Bdellovibrionales bacterium]